MSLRERTRPGLGIIEPCLPSPAERPPSGPGWLHEIKHDGFRIMARRDGAGIRLITRHGNDFTNRFPIIVAAVTALPARSFLIDGEAIVTNGDGLAVFDLIRHKRHGGAAVLCAFDLIELDGEDLRRSSIEYRKRKLAKLVRSAELGIVLNEHYEGDGEIIFKHACKLGCEASCQSGLARCIALAVRRIGSRSRIRKRQRSRARPRKIGGGNSGFRCLSKLADAYFAVVAV
jgi:bifunctional non-homologous end joining protein LigD